MSVILFHDPYLQGWRCYLKPQNENNTKIELEIQENENRHQLCLIRTKQIASEIIEPFGQEPFNTIDLGNEAKYLIEKNKFEVLKASRFYEHFLQTLYNMDFPSYKVFIHIFPKNISSNSHQIIKIQAASEEIIKKKLDYHSNWKLYKIVKTQNLEAYCYPSNCSISEDLFDTFISGDQDFGFLPANFLTRDDDPKTYSIDMQERSLLGYGTYGTIYKFNNTIAGKFGSVNNEAKVLKELWNKIGKEWGIRGIQRMPIKTSVICNCDSINVLFQKIYSKKSSLITPTRKHQLDVLEGLFWMGQLGILHLDLKMDNILADANEAVIADFGSAYLIKDREDKESLKRYFIDDGMVFATSSCDSALWNELQQLTRGTSNSTTDEFIAKVKKLVFEMQANSIGISLYKWITRERPYEEKPFIDTSTGLEHGKGFFTPDFEKYLKDPTIQETLKNRLLQNSCDPDMADLIVKMIDPDPKNRLTFRELEYFLFWKN